MASTQPTKPIRPKQPVVVDKPDQELGKDPGYWSWTHNEFYTSTPYLQAPVMKHSITGEIVKGDPMDLRDSQGNIDKSILHPSTLAQQKIYNQNFTDYRGLKKQYDKYNAYSEEQLKYEEDLGTYKKAESTYEDELDTYINGLKTAKDKLEAKEKARLEAEEIAKIEAENARIAAEAERIRLEKVAEAERLRKIEEDGRLAKIAEDERLRKIAEADEAERIRLEKVAEAERLRKIAEADEAERLRKIAEANGTGGGTTGDTTGGGTTGDTTGGGTTTEGTTTPITYTPSKRVYTPINQQSTTYESKDYDPSAPTYETYAEVAPKFNPTLDFDSKYVAGPVEQTVTLPSSGGNTGMTSSVMYKNERGQQIPVTEIDGKAMTYIPPGYTKMAQGGMVGYAKGGDTNLNAEYNLASKFLGYKGPKSISALNDFMKASPGAAARMGKYQQAMMGMYKGGVVYAAEGVSIKTTGEMSGDTEKSAEDSFSYYDDVVPLFGEAVKQTMQPIQSTYTNVATDDNQFVSGTAGQVGTYAPTISADQVNKTTLAGIPEYGEAATYGATTSSGQVSEQTARTPTISGEVSKGAKVDAAQGTSSLDIDAAQGTATMMANPVTREIQDGELISGVADAQKAAKFTEQIQAAEATPSKEATVKGQLEGLMQDFEGGETPAWAAGAMRNAMGAMAARGLGASSLAGQAAVQAAMESALPIASADAQTIASFEAQNLSNRQQRAMLGAQQRAQFMGQEFDQAFQARVQNSSRIADVANMNFTAEQQVALENSRAANTMNLANLSNRQAGVMAESAAIANMDMANLNNRQQAAVQNAQNFMAMDMANLDKAQQTALFRSQQNIQALFTDQAAENAAMQFNSSSENQTKQFFASLSSQTSQFNSAQANATNQFNVNSSNAVNQFNANLQQQRDTFNASNGLVVAQANAQWRQNMATQNTAAQNESNASFASAINAMTAKNIDQVWQRERDLMSYNITSVESAKDRAVQIILGEQSLTALREKIGYDEDKSESEFFTRFLFGDFADVFKK